MTLEKEYKKLLGKMFLLTNWSYGVLWKNKNDSALLLVPHRVKKVSGWWFYDCIVYKANSPHKTTHRINCKEFKRRAREVRLDDLLEVEE